MIALSKDGPLYSVLLSFRHSNNSNGFSLSSPSSSSSSSSSSIEVITILLFIIGILISGYSCFAIGTVLALESTRAAVRVFGGYRKEWIQFLKYEAIIPKNYCRSTSATDSLSLLLKNKNKNSPSINKQTMAATATATATTSRRRNYRNFRPSTTNNTNNKSCITIYNNIKTTTSRHLLTGTIIGYRVEYEYCCPVSVPVEDGNDESKNDAENGNGNGNGNGNVEQQQHHHQSHHRPRELLSPMMRQQHQKTKRRPQTMIRIRRVVDSIRQGDKNEGSNNNSDKNCNYDSSGSSSGDSSTTRISYEYYPKDTVRSLVEYIQRQKLSEQKEKQEIEQQRKPETKEDHPDDSSNSSSSSGGGDNYSVSDNDDDDESSSSSDNNTDNDGGKDSGKNTSLPPPLLSPLSSPSLSSSQSQSQPPSSCTTAAGMMVLYPNNLNNQHKGIIMGYVNEKRRELLTYSELMEPCIIHFGINFYLLGTFLHAFVTCPTMNNSNNNNNNSGRTTTDIYDVDDDNNNNDHICYEHVRKTMIIALFGMITMIPYCIYEARSIQIKRIKLWKTDPMLDISKYNELERIRNLFRFILFFGQKSQDNNKNHEWYYYYMRKEIMYVPCFFLGILFLLLGCDIITLILGLTAVYCMVQWVHSSSPIKKDTLEGFKRDPCVLTNVMASLTVIDNNHNHNHTIDDDDDKDIISSEYEKKKMKKNRSSRWLWWSGCNFFGTDNNRNAVRISYIVPSPSSFPFSSSGIDKKVAKTNSTTVVKIIQSEFLYKKCTRNSPTGTGRASPATTTITDSIAATTTTTAPIHLHPDFPLSGYPTILLNRDISNSWSLLKWHVACLITLWCYLVSACIALEADVDGPPEDLWIAIIIMISGPFLLLPGASILRQIEYDRFLLDLFEPKASKSRIIIS